MSSPKDKHIIMDMTLKSLVMIFEKSNPIKIDWQRGNKLKVNQNIGAKKVST